MVVAMPARAQSQAEEAGGPLQPVANQNGNADGFKSTWYHKERLAKAQRAIKWGVGFAATGGALMVTGGILYIVAKTKVCPYDGMCGVEEYLVGIPMFLTGVTFLTAGVITYAIGKQKSRKHRKAITSIENKSRFDLQGIGLAVAPNQPIGLCARFSF